MRGWLLNSIMALVCFGLWAFLPKVSVRYISPKSALIYEVMGGVLVAIIVFGTISKGIDYDLRGITPAFITGIIGYLGMLFFLNAVNMGKVSIIASLTAVYPVIAIILAVIFLKEKMSLTQYIGIFLAVTGVILLSYE
ncbi:MAG: EamA family transporter [Deltaproteobacteria bacterium]|nr:MAG: EamA family transporter [Deltaproteobacteria bacterium]